MARPSRSGEKALAPRKVKPLSVTSPSPQPRVKRLRGAAAAKLLAYGKDVLRAEARAIDGLAERLGRPFLEAVELLLACPGWVVVTGLGKPGFIAQKLSATLASTGVRSLYLHPAEAVHGDLGRVSKGDVVLALSNSGATEEVLRLLPSLRRLGAQLIALTGDATSPLARSADVVLDIGLLDEACPLGLVPTTSSAVLHALGDALAMTMLEHRQFTQDDYAVYHPAGKLGRSVMRVFEVMRQGDANPVVREEAPLSEAVAVMTQTPGRPGATHIVDKHGRLVGIFTDGDLRRLVQQGQTDFARPISQVMGRHPRFIGPEALVLTAAALMRETRVDQLPVVDAEGKPVGLLDVQDLLAARFV